MSNFFTFPVAQHHEFTSSVEHFLDAISDGAPVRPEWDASWKILNRMVTQITILERKWAGYRKTTGIGPERVIRKDINVLFRKNVRGMLPGEEAVHYGLRTSIAFIDGIAGSLPYLRNTSFYAYNKEIRILLEGVITVTDHGEISKLLNEVEKHPDFISGGQLFSHETIEYYLFLKNPPSKIEHSSITIFLKAYEDFFSIFEKDMTFTYCLLKLVETRYRMPYAEVPRGPRSDTIDYCLKRIKAFRVAYHRDLRSARAHGNIEIDNSNQNVLLHIEGHPMEALSYEQVVTLCAEISALVLSFRLVVSHLSIIDWEAACFLLKIPLTPS